MDSFWSGIGMAAWLGILTSLSPCPLATNVAAISYIAREVQNTKTTFMMGLFYALGRMLVYVALGVILASGTCAVPRVSFFLQTKSRIFMGPLLIVIGLVLLDVFRFSFSGTLFSHKTHSRLAEGGVWGALLLGAVFALSFCPISAALFFGTTFGLAAAHGSRVIIPAVYGMGTAMPVAVLALGLAFSIHAIGGMFNKLRVFEKIARRVSGFLFIMGGIYLLLEQTLALF